uniref:Putative cytotoxin-like protein n=1 Tax=Ixodes ricinus TaxID=34613 RepID=A0A147BGK5_IXORI
MSVVIGVLPFVLSQLLFVKGEGHAYFPTGNEDKPIREKELQFNLQDVVMGYLYQQAKKTGANLWDMDVMGENTARPKNNNYPPVKARMSELIFGKAEIVSTKPLVAYSQLFHNGQPDRNETATIKKEIKHHNTYTYTVERGIDTGLSGEWSAGLPDVVGARTEISLKFSTLWGSTETKTTETTYSLNQVVTIPPESTVRVQLLIAEEVVNVPWSATMYLKGYFAGQFEKGGGWPWEFFGVGALTHPDVKYIAPDEILFHAKGTFSGITSKSSHTSTREKRHYR